MYSVLSYCKTYAPKGNHSLQNHQEWRHFHTELSKILIALSNTWENICFSGMEHCKLMQLTIFSYLRFIAKGIICILDGILKSLSLLLLESMCDLTNTIKPALFSVISSIYGLIILIYELIFGKRLIFFLSAIHKISTFRSTFLSKSPNLFLMELIFRYEKIM